MRRRAFLSYSHDDLALCDEFVKHVSALSDHLDVWRDEEGIRAGADWESRLRARLHGSEVLLALVSKNWGDSEWCQREWAEAERLMRIPVLLEEYAYEKHRVGKSQMVFGDRQRSPIVTRDRLTAELRDPAWRYAIDQISIGLGIGAEEADADHPPLTLPSDAHRVRWPRIPSRELTASFAGGGPWTVTYAWKDRPGTVARVLHEADLAREREKRGADGALSPRTPEAAVAVGLALTEWLLGPSADRKRLFGLAYPEGAASGAAMHATRLRLHGAPPAIAALPWETWIPTPLGAVGWTVERVVDAHTERSVHLANPCAVLVLGERAPAVAGRLRSALRPVWKSEADTMISAARTAEAAEAALPTFEPAVLVLTNPIEPGPTLKFPGKSGAPQRVGWAELLRGSDSPRLVAWAPERGVDASTLAALVTGEIAAAVGFDHPDVPFVWLRELFEYGVDPVTATSRSLAAHPGAAQIVTRFARFTTAPPRDPVQQYAPEDRLDRALAKADAVALARDLWRDDAAPIGVAVAPGEAAQALGMVGRQIEKHLIGTLQGDGFAVERVVASPPPGEAPTEGDFDAALRKAFDVEPRAWPGPALARARDGLAGKLPQARPLLLVDFGVVGAGTSAPYSPEWLETLARYAARALAEPCLPKLRVLFWVTVAAPVEHHAAIQEHAEQTPIRIHPSAPARGFSRGAHAIGRVTESDLRHFLEGRSNSNCPREHAAAAARAIFFRCGGDFSRACQELRLALSGGWDRLAQEGANLVTSRPSFGRIG